MAKNKDTEQNAYVSFGFDDYASGTKIDDVTATVAEAYFETWAHENSEFEERPMCTLVLDDADQEPVRLGCGNSCDWIETADGFHLKAVGSKLKLHEKSAFVVFLKSLASVGFPPNTITNDARCLIGLRAHFIQVDGGEVDGKKFTQTVVDRIDKMPGKGAKATKAPGKSKAKDKKPALKAKTPANAEATDTAGDLTAQAEACVMQAIEESLTGKLTDRNLPIQAFKIAQVKDEDTADDLFAMFQDEAFVADGDRPWYYDEASGSVEKAAE